MFYILNYCLKRGVEWLKLHVNFANMYEIILAIFSNTEHKCFSSLSMQYQLICFVFGVNVCHTLQA